MFFINKFISLREKKIAYTSYYYYYYYTYEYYNII